MSRNFVESCRKDPKWNKYVESNCCVVLALGAVVGVKPGFVEKELWAAEVQRSMVESITHFINLRSRGFFDDEVLKILPDYTVGMKESCGHINNFIGRLRNMDTNLGKGLQRYTFRFGYYMGVDIRREVLGGAGYLAVGRVKGADGFVGNHMFALGMGDKGEYLSLSDNSQKVVMPDEINTFGWVVRKKR